eukprot:7968913-Lingulodinium_polyedra.AAC.1
METGRCLGAGWAPHVGRFLLECVCNLICRMHHNGAYWRIMTHSLRCCLAGACVSVLSDAASG